MIMKKISTKNSLKSQGKAQMMNEKKVKMHTPSTPIVAEAEAAFRSSAFFVHTDEIAGTVFGVGITFGGGSS